MDPVADEAAYDVDVRFNVIGCDATNRAASVDLPLAGGPLRTMSGPITRNYATGRDDRRDCRHIPERRRYSDADEGRPVGSHNGVIRALIIHSPLVGPSTVQPLAAAMEALGWTTTVPDLRSAIASPARFGEGAASAVDTADIIIGHSGAGAFLPAVAAATRAATAMFIDAVVPPSEPLFTPSARLLQLLDTLPIVEGLLPPWHEWWPAGLMVELVPDMSLRRRITAEIPQVPRSFYDEAVAVPRGWWRRPAAYLQLSSAYADERTQADAWGWPTSQLAGRHLDVCVLPDLIAGHVADLVRQLDQRAR